MDDQLINEVRARTSSYAGCSPEQATVYACEDVVDQRIGSRVIQAGQAAEWIAAVCAREDIDVPEIVVARASRRSLASVDADAHVLCLRGRTTTAATILHEIAHLTCTGDSHGVLFRDELVRLGRAHISVEWAATLHGLYRASGLDMSPWPASAHRR